MISGWKWYVLILKEMNESWHGIQHPTDVRPQDIWWSFHLLHVNDILSVATNCCSQTHQHRIDYQKSRASLEYYALLVVSSLPCNKWWGAQQNCLELLPMVRAVWKARCPVTSRTYGILQCRRRDAHLSRRSKVYTEPLRISKQSVSYLRKKMIWSSFVHKWLVFKNVRRYWWLCEQLPISYSDYYGWPLIHIV